MNKIYTLLFLGLFLSVNAVQAQVPSLKAYEKAAKKEMEDKNFYAAMKYYSLALRKDKDTSRLYNMYNMAEAARQFKAFDKARESYHYVLANRETGEFPVAEYWLAKVYQQQGEYDSAIKYFKNITSPQVTTKGPAPEGSEVTADIIADAKSSIESCIWAKNQLSYPASGYNIKPFGDNVNTEWSEFAPVEHGNQVYYSSIVYDKENYCPNPDNEVTRLYSPSSSSQTVNSGTTSPINWAEQEDGKYVAHTAFNGEDGNRMYFTVCEKANAADFNCEIFFRTIDTMTGLWGDAVRLPDHVNRPGSNNTQPNIGFDDNTGKELLFFVSNRPDSVGGMNDDMNIYCSFIEANGQIGLPTRLNINTDEDDVTPFYNKEDKNLYFSSKGYQGFGGFDIYKSAKSGYGGGFETPEALAYPLNTSYDDIYFSTDEKFENAYLASNRGGAVVCSDVDMETCCHDIFELEIIKVDLNVYTFNEEAKRLFGEGDDKTKLDSCYIGLYDVATGEEIKVTFSSEDPDNNHAYFQLELEREYQVTANHGGRWTDTLGFVSTKGITTTTTLNKNLDLNPNVEIYAYTFDKETGEELVGCNFKFYNEDTGKLVYETDRLEDNVLYRNRILSQFGKNYKVVASKEDYSSDSVSFTTEGLYLPSTLRDSLYLTRAFDPTNITVILYFDNDEPDSNTTRTYSTVNYEQSYDKYNVPYRVSRFIAENGKDRNRKELTGEERNIAQKPIKDFFDFDVPEGMRQLRILADLLDKAVQRGGIYLLEIEGSASPRSPSKYNRALTSRRVSSVKKYLRRYSQSLSQAIDNNKLQFELIPRGEDPSKGLNIPSKYSDPNSIYSVEASRQRNVKIRKIRRLDKVGYPIELYFDWNQPRTATQSYQQSYDQLMSTRQRQNYIELSTANLSGEMKTTEREYVRSFFENEIKGGLINLKVLAQFLERNLPMGKKYQIDLTAPGNLASNKVSSVEVFLKRYNGGVLSQYINSGSLQFNAAQTGEVNSGNPAPSKLSIEGLQERKMTITGMKEIR